MHQAAPGAPTDLGLRVTRAESPALRKVPLILPGLDALVAPLRTLDRPRLLFLGYLPGGRTVVRGAWRASSARPPSIPASRHLLHRLGSAAAVPAGRQ